nr:unnamed protein product [Callosobruchus analis]
MQLQLQPRLRQVCTTTTSLEVQVSKKNPCPQPGRGCKPLSPTRMEQLLLLYKAQIRPSLEDCSHNRAVRLIDTHNLTKDLHSLEHRRRVAGLSPFYRFYHGRCSSELSQIITPKAVRTRNNREALHAHLYQALQSILRTRGVSRYRRIGCVQPVPEKAKTDPNNYRPVTLLNIMSKVMETVINTQLLNYLDNKNIIYDRHYGFRKHTSTGDLLAYVTHMSNTATENHGESRVVALDISKAFDRVWHLGVLPKLAAYGVSPGLRRFADDSTLISCMEPGKPLPS